MASIEPEWQYAKIKRLDIDRTINVSTELNADGNASAIMKEMTPWICAEASELARRLYL